MSPDNSNPTTPEAPSWLQRLQKHLRLKGRETQIIGWRWFDPLFMTVDWHLSFSSFHCQNQIWTNSVTDTGVPGTAVATVVPTVCSSRKCLMSNHTAQAGSHHWRNQIATWLTKECLGYSVSRVTYHFLANLTVISYLDNPAPHRLLSQPGALSHTLCWCLKNVSCVQMHLAATLISWVLNHVSVIVASKWQQQSDEPCTTLQHAWDKTPTSNN